MKQEQHLQSQTFDFDNPPAFLVNYAPAPLLDEIGGAPVVSRYQLEKFKTIDWRGLAFDIVVYGGADLRGVLSQHDLTLEDYESLKNTPSLTREIAQIKSEFESSPDSGVRMRARNVVEAGLMSMHEIISAPTQDPKARVSAFEAAVKVADLMPKANKDVKGGQTVEINFGGLMPSISINAAQDSEVIDV